ncbi:unnamed protein product [Rotaria socialis]|uniref:Uncharacterized protein n=1 Tax=Rotaria socialis TaxID=392032 RepID=A0A818DPV3_9BILA|nr:unnamed protein product [Rotaria socialis]CAF3451210.1 unnamed protein product [Rotaria socialis]CAF3519832.1 unnamed protein product [Rotaria socialis]
MIMMFFFILNYQQERQICHTNNYELLIGPWFDSFIKQSNSYDSITKKSKLSKVTSKKLQMKYLYNNTMLFLHGINASNANFQCI